jgi:hypothetical protein
VVRGPASRILAVVAMAVVWASQRYFAIRNYALMPGGRVTTLGGRWVTY